MQILTLNTTKQATAQGESMKAYKNKTSDKQARKDNKAFRSMRKNKRNMWQEA